MALRTSSQSARQADIVQIAHAINMFQGNSKRKLSDSDPILQKAIAHRMKKLGKINTDTMKKYKYWTLARKSFGRPTPSQNRIEFENLFNHYMYFIEKYPYRESFSLHNRVYATAESGHLDTLVWVRGNSSGVLINPMMLAFASMAAESLTDFLFNNPINHLFKAGKEKRYEIIFNSLITQNITDFVLSVVENGYSVTTHSTSPLMINPSRHTVQTWNKIEYCIGIFQILHELGHEYQELSIADGVKSSNNISIHSYEDVLSSIMGIFDRSSTEEAFNRQEIEIISDHFALLLTEICIKEPYQYIGVPLWFIVCDAIEWLVALTQYRGDVGILTEIQDRAYNVMIGNSHPSPSYRFHLIASKWESHHQQTADLLPKERQKQYMDAAMIYVNIMRDIEVAVKEKLRKYASDVSYQVRIHQNWNHVVHNLSYAPKSYNDI